jgi:citrate lyase subunit beta/citryl-CoA lyase
VNGTHTGRTREDVDAIVCADVDCIMVPKVEDTAALAEVDTMIAAAEQAQGVPVGSIRVIGLVETARGLIVVEQICAAAPDRVVTIGFGAGDFTVDLGIDLTSDGREVMYARSRIVVAARAAGLRAPIDGPFLDLQNVEALTADTQLSRQLGFDGRVVVYPPQVEHVHRAYSDLPPDEVELVTSIVEEFEAAEAGGLASIQVAGRFVDYPIYHRAKKKLRLYRALKEQG